MSALLAVARAELTKIVTLRSVWLTLGAVLAIQVLVSALSLSLYADAVAAITPDGMIEIFVGQPQEAEQAMLESLVASSLQMCIFLPVVAAVVAGQELRGRQLRTSLLAVPARGRLMTAKLVAATVFLLVPASLVALVSAVFTHLAVQEWKPGLVVSPAALSAQARFIAFAVALCLVTYAITLAARSIVVAVVAAVILTTVTMGQLVAPGLDRWLPVSAGRNLLLDPVSTPDLTSGPVLAALVLVAWVLVTGTGAGASLARRDAP